MSDSRHKDFMAPIFKLHMESRVTVKGFNHNDLFLNKVNNDIINRLRYRLFPKQFVKHINIGLLRSAESFEPNVLLLFKGQEILPETLVELKKMGIYLVNYNLDHPFDYASRGSGNRFVRDSFPLYDLHITYSSEIQKQIHEKFPQMPVKLLPFGYDQRYQKIVETDINEVCFVGGPDSKRSQILESLAKKGYPVNVYGPGWSKILSKHSKIKLHSPVSGDEYYNVLRKYRVQLNIFRSHNFGSHNMRSIEIPGAGGIMLAPNSTDQKNMFEEGKEAFFYEDIQELEAKIDLLLKIPQTEATTIRERAVLRCKKSGYSYKDRANQLIAFLPYSNE